MQGAECAHQILYYLTGEQCSPLLWLDKTLNLTVGAIHESPSGLYMNLLPGKIMEFNIQLYTRNLPLRKISAKPQIAKKTTACKYRTVVFLMVFSKEKSPGSTGGNKKALVKTKTSSYKQAEKSNRKNNNLQYNRNGLTAALLK